MIDAAHDLWMTEGVMTRRVVAFLIDGMLVALLALVLKIVLVAFGILTLGLGFALLAILPLVPFAYVVGFIAFGRGATPGQLAMGLLVRCNDDLDRPSWAQALVWTIGLAVTLSFGVIWVAVALITVRHRTLHDMVSGVVVTRARAIIPRTGIWNADPPWRRPFA